VAGQAKRLGLIRQAFRLEWLTIGWMTVEAVVAIASGITAGSVPLTAFGIDSVIDRLSASLTSSVQQGSVSRADMSAPSQRRVWPSPYWPFP
jgi:hypothetical protein